MISSAAGPFQQAYPQSSVQTPFQRLKPVCVELLSLTGRTTGSTKSHQVLPCLSRLKSTLRALLSDNNAHASEHSAASSSRLVAGSPEPVLSAPLINYVFYPLSELISTAPKGITSLPDTVLEAVLDVLALLCSQWWIAWAADAPETSSQSINKSRQVWCDLVILSSSVLGTPTGKPAAGTDTRAKMSDEVKLAALHVLEELLSPRFSVQQSISNAGRDKERAKQVEWEWDGVSNLPLLEDQNETTNTSSGSTSRSGAQDSPKAQDKVTLVFPTPKHLTFAATERVAKGAISFVLSSCFSIAESSQENTEVRTAAIGTAYHALLLWIGGACPQPSAPTQQDKSEQVGFDLPSLHYIDVAQPSQLDGHAGRSAAHAAVASRLRPLLPGLTSSLTRLAMSRIKSKHDGIKQKATPSIVAVGAIELLRDLFRATLSDECLVDVLANQSLFERSRSSAEMSTKVTSLEDFAETHIDNHSARDLAGVDPADTDESTNDSAVQPSASKDAQWALSTLAQVQLALKTFSPLTQPSLPGTSLPSPVHASVQTAILRFAAALLSECAGSFAWLDQQLESMARLDATSVNKDSATVSDSSNTSSIPMLFCWIVDLASSYNSETVSRDAKSALSWLQKEAQERKQAGGGSAVLAQISSGAVLWSVLMHALRRLPATITAHNDEGASRLSLRVSTALELLRQHAPKGGLAGTKLSQDMQDTCVRLLRPLKVGRMEHVEEASPLPGSTTWRLQPLFSGLEASTSTQLSRMFFDVGRSLALAFVHEVKTNRTQADYSESFSLITFLVERAARLRSVTLDSAANQDALRRGESLASLVVAADLMRGVSSCLDNLELGMLVGSAQAGKQARKVAHRLGKRVAKLVLDMLDVDAEEAIRSRAAESSTVSGKSSVGNFDAAGREVNAVESSSSDQTLVERVKGISLASDDIASTTPDRHGPALDLAFVRAANLSKPPSSASSQHALQQRHQQASRNIDQSNALLFALLGSSSKLLGQSFRPLLLRGAYPLISGMSALSTGSSELVRHASSLAMKDIAFNTAYGDVRNCLLDHADYILGAACQRLISGLDEELRAIADAGDGGVGSSSRNERSDRVTVVVLPLVSAQRAPFVLVEMIRVLGSEIIPMVEDAIDEILDALDRFHHHPTICDGLLAVLDSILKTMALEQASKPSRKVDLIAADVHESKRDEVEVFKSWLAARRGDQPAFDAAPDKSDAEEKEDNPTKSQQVATQILTKASMFLTHPSPLLRTRVLGLIGHGIETLAPQARTPDLLPIINAAWPFILTRLGPAYTSTRASKSTQLSPIVDLSPAAIGAAGRQRDEATFRKMEEGFVERDANVWTAAARVVEVASREVGEFVGKRVVDDAWPRFEMLLTLMRWKFDARRGGEATGGSGALTWPASSEGAVKKLISDTHRSTPRQTYTEPYILPTTSSLPAQLTLTIVRTLTTVVHHLGAHLPDDAAWHITTHPHLLGLLDARQPPAVLRAAEALYAQLGRRNPEATAWVLRASFPEATEKAVGGGAAEKTPCFMRARAKVHQETVYHLLSGFGSV